MHRQGTIRIAKSATPARGHINKLVIHCLRAVQPQMFVFVGCIACKSFHMVHGPEKNLYVYFFLMQFFSAHMKWERKLGWNGINVKMMESYI